MPTEPREALHISASVPEVPHAECGRCDDWTTVVVKGVIFPCPACRPEAYKEWRTDGNELPRL